MTEQVKKIKQVCKCENCGNEAEMVVTCTLPESAVEIEPRNPETAPGQTHSHQKVKGTATCSHCGNEADMWIDI